MKNLREMASLYSKLKELNIPKEESKDFVKESYSCLSRLLFIPSYVELKVKEAKEKGLEGEKALEYINQETLEAQTRIGLDIENNFNLFSF